MPAGRPVSIEPSKLIEKFKRFVRDNDYPHINAFCLMFNNQEGIGRTRFYQLCDEIPELMNTKEKALIKQSLYLEMGGLTGSLNNTMSIFILKQPCHGYTDKQVVENIGETKIYIDVVDDDGGD